MRVIGEKDRKLKADELGQKRMIFYLNGFKFNDGLILLLTKRQFLRIYVESFYVCGVSKLPIINHI